MADTELLVDGDAIDQGTEEQNDGVKTDAAVCPHGLNTRVDEQHRE